MSAPANGQQLLDLVRQSGLVEAERLNLFLRQSGALPADSGKMSDLLIQAGLVTIFQAEQLLKGKRRGFSIAHYDVLERLAAASNCCVYLCERADLDRLFAVRVLLRSADETSRERLLRKARAMASLDHPAFPRVYEIGEDAGYCYVVMEYVRGKTLTEIIEATGPLVISRAVHYIAAAACGLQALHDRNLVHRNMKPKHLMLNHEGAIKIIGLGLVTVPRDREGEVETDGSSPIFLGTPQFTSPEQSVDSRNVDTRTDLYSLGATFYYLLTGHAPVGRGTLAEMLTWQQTQQPEPIRSVRPELPGELEAIVARMMAKDRDHRYQSAREVAEALLPWTQIAIAPPPESEMPQLCPAVRNKLASGTVA
jgi:serine/threonine protein kinase